MGQRRSPLTPERVAWFTLGYVAGVCSHGVMHAVIRFTYRHWPF